MTAHAQTGRLSDPLPSSAATTSPHGLASAMIATNRPSGIFVSPASMQSASSGKNGKSIVKNKNISCFSSMIGRYFSITPLSRNRCTAFRPSARAAKNTITDPAITASTPKIIAGQKPSASAPAIIEMLLGIGATMTVIICSAKYTAPAQTPAPAITSRSASTELIFSKNPFFQSAQPPAAKSAATASAAKMMRIIFFRFINSFRLPFGRHLPRRGRSSVLDARQCALLSSNALFFLNYAIRSSLFEGILLAARCAGNRHAKCRRSVSEAD